MTRLPILASIVVMVGFALPVVAAEHAAEVEAAQLLSRPGEWDGRRVAVSGELVGDYSTRADEVWVQLNDDSFVGSPIGAGGDPGTTNVGIGARIPTHLFGRIDGPPGRYGRTGPIVRLEGVFFHSDPELQGETYIAVDSATPIAPAEMHPRPGPDMWLAIGLGLFAVAGVVLYTGRPLSPPGEERPRSNG